MMHHCKVMYDAIITLNILKQYDAIFSSLKIIDVKCDIYLNLLNKNS